MRIRKEDLDAAMEKDPFDGIQCWHACAIALVPGPEGEDALFVLRIASHSDPGPDATDDGYVPLDQIKITDFGLDLTDIYTMLQAAISGVDTYTAYRANRN